MAAEFCLVLLMRSSRYRGKGADMSKLPQFQMHETDVGSAQYQIARLTARIAQLTKHLQVHKKDLACERGLKLILSSRKKLLFYLYNNQRYSGKHSFLAVTIMPPCTPVYVW